MNIFLNNRIMLLLYIIYKKDQSVIKMNDKYSKEFDS